MAHRHRANPRKNKIRAYTGPIVGAVENRRAHGGIRYTQECDCGATRSSNCNGVAEERGPWVAPDKP
jgi:hypothetical protein